MTGRAVIARSGPDPVEEAVEHIVGNLVHELRRADKAPIVREANGERAPYHLAAVNWGWLALADGRAQRLKLTPIGAEILRQAGPAPAPAPRSRF